MVFNPHLGRQLIERTTGGGRMPTRAVRSPALPATVAQFKYSLVVARCSNFAIRQASGGYSGRLGDAFVEEIFTTPEIAPELRFAASLRLVFPTRRQSPYLSLHHRSAMRGRILAY
jgi:hypothetical protein